MHENQKMVTLKCDCGCCMVVVEKSAWREDDVWYDVSIQDSRYDHDVNTVVGRIKRAAKALFGKPIWYNDANINEERFAKFVSDLRELQDWVPEEGDGE